MSNQISLLTISEQEAVKAKLGRNVQVSVEQVYPSTIITVNGKKYNLVDMDDNYEVREIKADKVQLPRSNRSIEDLLG